MKIIRHFSRTARYALVSTLIATALALSVIRFWLLPQVAAYREELQRRIGETIAETVIVHSLSARLYGLDPEVVLNDVEIVDAAKVRSPLRFRRVRARLNLIGSLMAGAPVLRGIALEGAAVTLRRDRDGTIGILGLKGSGHPPAWLFAEGAVQFRDIELEWRDLQSDREPLPLGQANLLLRNEAGRHRLSAALVLPKNLGRSLKLAADIQGNVFESVGWRGRLYLEGNRIGEGLLGDRLPSPIRLKSGAASFKLWGDWQNGAISQVTGQLDLAEPRISYRGAADSEGQLALNRVGGQFRWQREAEGWRLDVNRFSLALYQQSWPRTRFSIAVAGDAAGHVANLRAAASYIRFDDAHVLFDALPILDKTGQDGLRGLSLRGEARDVRLVYVPGAVLGERWALCGELNGLGFNAWQSLPGLNRFNGQICGNDRGGRIRFSAENAELSALKLLRKPIPLRTFEGAIDWRQTDEQWRIASSGIKLTAPGLEAESRFEFALSKADGISPFLDLRAHLTNVEANSLRDYLPLAAMPENSAVWLDRAFAAGRVSQADVLFHGFLADFPFAGGEGVFEALADAEDIELNFDPEWPHLYGVDARLRFSGAGVLIDASRGRIGEAPISFARAEALDLKSDSWLTVTGEVETNLPQSMQFLQRTPLRDIPARLLKVADPRGETTVALNLKVPLVKDKGRVEIDGSARFKNAALTVTAMNLEVQHIDGSLHFTRDGLDAQNIKAIILGDAAEIGITREGDDILVEAAGRANVPTLRNAFPASFWKYVRGASAYRLSLQLPESMDAASDPRRLTLASDLLGLAVSLPAPLGKPEGAVKDFRAEFVVQAGSKTPLSLVYGDEARAQLVLSEPSAGFKLERGDLALGRPLPPATKEPGLNLYASLGELNLDAWRSLLSEEGDVGERSIPVVRAFDFDFARLSWGGVDRGRWSLVGRHQESEWSGTLDSPFAKGRFQASTPQFGWPSLKLDLDYLKLPKLSEDKPERGPGANLDPAVVPTLQINGKQLLWHDVDLGAIEFETEHWTQGVNVKRLIVQKANHQLSLRGSWMRVEGQDETKAEGRAIVKDLGEFITQLGYGQEVRDTPTEADFSLSWPGAPYRFSAGSVAGDIKLNLGRGGVLKMDPGLGRALGVLNLNTLRRLLLLDFSDLFGKGLAYDSMEGRFHLGEGQARTSGFVIDAVAAEIVISGRIGLLARDFDEVVAVVPHTLATLPIAGALVGGAALDAALSVARKLIGKESASIASTNYAVKGSWDEPQITRIGGYMPLDMLDRAWAGLRDLSGFGVNGEEK